MYRPDIPRTGIGYDVHRLVARRRCMLGGIEIPYGRGLDGHSDADVVLHALADALLGAATLGDIGQHFPPGDPAWKDMDSRDIVRAAIAKLGEVGMEPVHVDITIIAEEPRIGPYLGPMRASIGQCLAVPESAVSIKATTNERMGFIGRGEGIAALAVATIAARSVDPQG